MSQNVANITGAGWIQMKPIVASGTDIVYLIVIFGHVFGSFLLTNLYKIQALYTAHVIYLQKV